MPFFVEPFSAPLTIDRAPESNQAIAAFSPDRDETKTNMTLRLRFDDCAKPSSDLKAVRPTRA